MTISTNKFYIGDNVEIIKNNIPDNFIDITVTSPPYDNLRDYTGYGFDYKSILYQIYRVTKVGGVLVWVIADGTEGGSETLTSFKHALYAKEECGFLMHDTMIYQKAGNLPTRTRYVQEFEFMFILTKGRPKTFNPIKDKVNKWAGQSTFGVSSFRNKDGTLTKNKKRTVNDLGMRTNVWRYANGYGFGQKDKIAYGHPATFPEKLVEDHILSWSNKGDIVLDPFVGSGTTTKQAWLNERQFIGIDCSEEYINNICIPRMEKYGWKIEE